MGLEHVEREKHRRERREKRNEREKKRKREKEKRRKSRRRKRKASFIISFIMRPFAHLYARGNVLSRRDQDYTTRIQAR